MSIWDPSQVRPFRTLSCLFIMQEISGGSHQNQSLGVFYLRFLPSLKKVHSREDDKAQAVEESDFEGVKDGTYI